MILAIVIASAVSGTLGYVVGYRRGKLIGILEGGLASLRGYMKGMEQK
jgi:hypothetical protein